MTALANWAGNVDLAATRVHHPTTVDEVRRVVAASRRVRVLGAGHSFTALSADAEDLIVLDRLATTTRIDVDAMTIDIPGGLRHQDVVADLQRSGSALANLAALPHITVAGACATGTHGSGDANQVLGAAVIRIEVVGAGGELHSVDRSTHPDTFDGWVVALGALGVVTRLTLAIVPTYAVAQRLDEQVPLDVVTARLDAILGGAYSVSVFTDWRSDALVWSKYLADRPVPAVVGGRPASVQLHPCPGEPPESCSQQLEVPGPWHERLPHFRPGLVPGTGNELQTELFVRRDRAPAACALLAERADEIAPVLHIGEVRSIAADDLWLSPAQGHDVVSFHFTWHHDWPRVRPVLEMVEDALSPLAPRAHWAKLSVLTPGQRAAAYERTWDFAHLARTVDPDRVFRNPFLAGILAGA